MKFIFSKWSIGILKREKFYKYFLYTLKTKINLYYLFTYTLNGKLVKVNISENVILHAYRYITWLIFREIS